MKRCGIRSCGIDPIPLASGLRSRSLSRGGCNLSLGADEMTSAGSAGRLLFCCPCFPARPVPALSSSIKSVNRREKDSLLNIYGLEELSEVWRTHTVSSPLAPRRRSCHH